MDLLKSFRLLSLFFVLSVLASCGGTDGNNSSAVSATSGTGRVSLLVTDGVTDDFDEVNLTVTSISFIGGDDGHETIVFNESKVINLLALQNYSDLLVTAVIPAGTYDKIRFQVTEVELVKEGQNPVVTKLPANGKVDLNPRGTFEIIAGGHLMIELDVDAEKSIHIVKKGNGTTSYNFRPVVFVNIVGVDDEVKLVLLQDRQVSDRSESGFLLCEDSDDAVHHDENDSDDNDDEDDHSSCIAVVISDNTVVQDDLIEVVSASDVVDGQIVTLLGKLSHESIDALHIVIKSADKSVSDLALFNGPATSDFAVDNFTMNASMDDGAVIQPVSLTELTIALVEGSGVRVFDKNGDEVSADTIVVDTDVDVFGLAQPDISTVGKVKSAFIIVDNAVKADKISGTIAGVDEAGSQVTVSANLGDVVADVCVDTKKAIIFILAIVDGKVVTKEITIANLDTGMLIDVYGDDDGLGCVAADVILVAESLAVTPVEPSLLLVTGN